ncbi:DUF1932 domain-containing protein [Sphingomonas sp. BGYR3]|uniref:DUF1932 domain-containing protein n=1 Tax=Sphingomonas sp. BGYR3 TaxID=2975483 RepID=UPI0021A52842|nr:NAD(P)-dependent oxidoreductase [Sphingomonas sp. BGYR3]MDG5489677.1 DUF1932 domain-containing protein [Sphingomonas sp. BGYR3]
MTGPLAFVGFGEAGLAFSRPGDRAFDIRTESAATRDAQHAAYAAAQVTGVAARADLSTGASAVLSLVTADQAVAAARAFAPLLPPGTLWLDMNSVAPDTKRAAGAIIDGAGGRYVDVAVMSPVYPARHGVPLLLAGAHAADAARLMTDAGFTHVSVAGPAIGDASAIKMIRSVMVKGIEALSAECIRAAAAAGVADAVIASLDASWREQSWADRFDYNLDRMLAHGLRRAAEMEEVVLTLESLGVDPAMTRGTIARQRELGSLGLTPPDGLSAKLAAIRNASTREAA